MLSATILFSLMSHIPIECSLNQHCKQQFGYQYGRDAWKIANVVADEQLPDREAIEAIVYAAYESNNNLAAIGDHGHGFGAWQLRYRYPSASLQLRAWRYLRAQSLLSCGSMAALESGYCDRAREKVSLRETLIEHLNNEVVPCLKDSIGNTEQQRE